MSDMHDALNELAQRGTPRGFDAVFAAASDAAVSDAVDVVDVGGAGARDDLEAIPFVTAEPVRRRRRPMEAAIAAAGVAALVLVSSFAVSAVVGSGGSGAGSPEGAVRRLADALSHEDPLAAADVFAPDEVRTLHGTLDAAAHRAADLQLVQTAGAPLAGVDFNVSGLSLSTDSLGDGYAKVTVDAGTFSARTHKAQFSALMQKVLRNASDNSTQDDLAQLEADKNLPTFLIVVRRGGRWYVSASYTLLEYIRENDQLPAADFGSGARAAATLGADSPDAAVQESMRALQSQDWSKLLTMFSPSEIPLYDYRAALTTLARRDATNADGSKSSFTIDTMTTDSQVSGDTAKVTLHAAGTTDSGRWSLDGGCFSAPGEAIALTCAGGGARLRVLGVSSDGLDASSQITAVKQDGRWFVSPVGTVLDVIDRYIARIDRRFLFTLLGIPDQLPPDGTLVLGRPVELHPTTSLFGLQVLTFQGRKGESLLGLSTASTSSGKPSSSSIGGVFDGAQARVFTSDGTEIDNGGDVLAGQPLVLPADAKYTFVLQSVDVVDVSTVTVTIWDTADAPAAARQNQGGESCTYTLGGETCYSSSSASSAVTATTVLAGSSGAGISVPVLVNPPPAPTPTATVSTAPGG